MKSGDVGKEVLALKASEVVIRTLRHEVGDLLQTIYAAAAILNQRLPAGWELERRVVADLRTRGESCRKYLDFAQDFVSPPPLERDRFLVSDKLAETISKIGSNHPSIQAQQEIEPDIVIWCDTKKMDLVFQLLVSHAYESAYKKVWIGARIGKESNSMEATLDYDLDKDLARSFPSDSDRDLGIAHITQNARSRLTLLLAEKFIKLHGGQIDLVSSNQGVCRIAFWLPGPRDLRVAT
jgi:hypothetical protein